MKKRRASKKAQASQYLSNEYEEVQTALAAMALAENKSLVRCDDDLCRGVGKPGEPCPLCNFVLPNSRGNTMPIQIPSTIKHGTQQTAVSHYGYGSGGGTWGGWTGGSDKKTYASCTHTGDKVIYESDNKQLYISSGTGLDEFSGKWKLIIDLANNIRYGDIFGFVREKSHKKFTELRKYTFQPAKVASDVLDLAWPDMAAPPCSLDFWIKLWDLLPESTVIACFGGHGRSGTCAAALMIASGVDYYAAVDIIRTKHCDKAIETLPQEKYLHGIYMEMLKRNIKNETDEKLLTDLKEDLAYAEAFVPNAYSSYGEPTPATAEDKKDSSSTSAKSGTGTGLAGRSAEDLAQDNLKVVGDRIYEQMCVSGACKDTRCTEPSHMGWVEYDPVQDETLWAH